MSRDVYGRVTLRLIPLLVVIYLFAYIDRTVVGFAQLQMGADIGLSATAFGLGAGIFFVAYALLEVPSNLLLVRFGPRTWFARIMITWGLITMAMAFSQGPTSFYILRFLLGMAEAGFYPGILYLITQWFPASRRGRIVGLFLLANPLALAIGSPLAAGLLGLDGTAGLAGWQWIFLIVGAPPLLLAIVVLMILPNSPQTAPWLTQEDKDRITTDIAREERDNGAVAMRNPLHALKNPKVLLLAAFFLCYPLTGYGLSMWLPSIISRFGVSTTATGWLATLPWIAAATALITIPRRAEKRRSPYAHIAVTLAIAGAGLVLTAVLHDPVLQMVTLCLAAFGIFAGQPIFWSLPSRILVGSSAAAGLAFVNSVGSLGGFLGPYGVGAVTDALHSKSAGLIFLAAFAVYGLVMLHFVHRMMQRHTLQANTETSADPETSKVGN